MAVIVNDQPEDIPGIYSTSFRDDPRLKLRMSEDMSKRVGNVRGIVLHTTRGIPGGVDRRPQQIRPGIGAPVQAGLKTAMFWSTAHAGAGAHLIVDFDGSVSCCADLLLHAAYHAGPVNQATIGIEIYQGGAAELYEGQLDAVVLLCDWLTRRFGIQRQVPLSYPGHALNRFSFVGASGRDVFGIYGHRDVSNNRGAGDPGDAVFERLVAAGYEAFNFEKYSDLTVWTERQKLHNVHPADGIPGPGTVAALASSGIPHGIWVRRPGDDAAPVVA